MTTDPATQRAIAEIAFPLFKVEYALQHASPETNTWFDVANAHDHDEAADFVRNDWDKIALYWQGTDLQMRFLRAFMDNFPPRTGQ